MRYLREGLFAVLLAGGAAGAWAAPVLGPEIKVNVATVNIQFTPQVAVFPDGGFVVAWAAEPKGLSPRTIPTVVVHARFYAASGAPLGGELLLARPVNLFRLDAVVTSANDRFAMVWEGYATPPSDRGPQPEAVFAQMFRRNGSPLTQPVQANLRSRFNRGFGIAAPTPGGGVVVAWSADTAARSSPQFFTNAVARIFSPRLAPLSGELTLAAGTAFDNTELFLGSVAMAPDGSLAATVTTAGDDVSLAAVRVAPNGTPLPTGDLDSRGVLGNDTSLAMTPDGSFAVVWDNENPGFVPLPLPPQPASPIRGQMFDSDGTARSPSAFQVNRRVPGQRITPQILWLPPAGGGGQGSGGFLTIWQEESSQDGQGSGIFGHLLDAAGTPYGGDFLVNGTTAGNQINPLLAAGPRGAVAIWQDGATSNIYARQIAVP